MNTELIYEAIYNMLVQANTKLNKNDYEKLANCDTKIKAQILKNAYLADKNKRPLCQDTGQVIVFLNVGQEVKFEGEFIEDIINKAVSDCYKNNFYRKSVVKDAIFDRTNTGSNTPCIIHTKFQKGNEVSILIGVKGGGAENMTRLKMMNPTSSIDDIFEFANSVIEEAGENACPPMVMGIGIGGTAEIAALNAKLALFKGKTLDKKFKNVIETKIISSPTHIASLPVCINLNCHSIRHSECVIKDDKITYLFENYDVPEFEAPLSGKKINTDGINSFKNLKTGDKILLSGKIYTARDAAHKRLVETIQKGEPLPFDLNGAVIFYAGPCPKTQNEIIGPIGPTTSKRMDKFAITLYKNGVMATIGKGERTIKNTGYIYLKATGGVANVYKNCVKSAKLIAYNDLGTEAIYRLDVSNMPLTVEII